MNQQLTDLRMVTFAAVSSATSRWTWTSVRRASSAELASAVTDGSCASATTGKDKETP